MMTLKDKRVLVTGGYGFFGQHLMSALEKSGIKTERFHSSEYDLTEYQQVFELYKDYKPEVIFHLASLVGGIGYNQKNPARIWHQTLLMGLNLLQASQDNAGSCLKKIIMVGTVCSYPKVPPSIPFLEEDLFKGYPEETNAPYGIAKSSLLVGAQAYRKQYGLNVVTLLPTNLYGPSDHFDLENSHVIPALIKKFVNAKEEAKPFVQLWGTGSATRTFLYAQDAAEGLVQAAEQYELGDPVNLASNDCISIRSIAELIKHLVGYEGGIVWDPTKPDGQPHRVLDTRKAEQHFGFKAKTGLEEGLKKTIEWYLEVRGE